MSTARSARSVAALAIAAGGIVAPVTVATVLTAGPAAAATCGGGPGVTVVVDRAGLGGGASTGCDGDGAGQGALENFEDAGVRLQFAENAGGPGFVCRVNKSPTSPAEDCQGASPADAYWGLWWSDGRSGKWNYSGVGVGSLTVPAGGSVAFRFSNGDKTPPSVAPPVKATSDGGTSGGGASGGSGTSGGSGSSGGGAAPSTPAPSTPAATPSPSATAASPTPTSTASAAPGAQDGRGDRRRVAPGDATGRGGREGTPDSDDRKDARDRRTATPTPATAPETEQETTLVDDPVDPQASQTAAADGLPVWVAPVLVAGLLLVGGAVAAVRRLRGAPGRS